MPKKTRQEKILAELHRLQEQQKKSEVEVTTSPDNKVSLNIPLKETPVTTETVSKNLSENYSYVFSDLRKTIIFAVGAILFEIVLSIFLNSQSFFH